MLIAVIDDQRDIIEYVRAVLEEEGYAVAAWLKEMGAAAFVLAKNPAVVLLDLHMEERDAGIRIAEALCADPQTTHVPMILSIAQPDLTQTQYARLRVLHCGWLPKPYLLGMLLSVVTGASVGVVRDIPEPGGIGISPSVIITGVLFTCVPARPPPQ